MTNCSKPIDLVLSLLPTAKPNGSGWQACCPAHDDQTPSLSINEGDDGRVLLNCFAGCSHDQIVPALGLESKDLFVSRRSHNEYGESAEPANSSAKPQVKGTQFATPVVAVSSLTAKFGPSAGQWTYHDAEGKPVAYVLRFDDSDGGKEFRPVSCFGPGRWHVSAPQGLRPLYRLTEIAEAETVFVCEGEKAADAARSIGVVATTSMGGSQAADKTDWTPLVGKVVVILPDNDESGIKYAEAVAEILRQNDPSPTVKILKLPELPPKGDIVEWIEGHGEAAEQDSMRDELMGLAGRAELVEQTSTKPNSDHFEPFPVDILPPSVGAFVTQASAAIGCDESFIALPVLAMVGAAIGNTRRLVVKPGWTEPPIVWTLIVGNSGSCKSPAIELALKPVKERQAEAFRQHSLANAEFLSMKASHSKVFEQWRRDRECGDPPVAPVEPCAERFLADDTTIESLAGLLKVQPRGLLVARDEMAGWLSSFDRYASGKGGDVAKWLEMFGGRPIIIDRKTGEPKTLYIQRASVCLTGGIQPETLKRCLVQSHLENGLAARLLFAAPPARPRRWTDAVVDEEVGREFCHVVDMLFNLNFETNEFGETAPKLVTLTPGAQRRFKQFVDEQGAEHVDLSDDLSAAWSKLEGYAARFALILHLCRAAMGDGDELIVDEQSIEAGITLARWFGHEAKRVYEMLRESADDGERRKLIDWISRRGGSVTAREVCQGHRRFRKTADAEIALTELVNSGVGRWEPISTTPKGGRSSRRFVLIA